jgi:two-component system, NtrC family, sensor kinase
MVLHELTTNAAKYGAFSTNDGQVSVRWFMTGNAQARSSFCIKWQETGGPSVSVPQRSGYGMEVIHGLVPYELDGKVDLEFAPGGVCCILTIPAAALGSSNLPNSVPVRDDEGLAAL